MRRERLRIWLAERLVLLAARLNGWADAMLAPLPEEPPAPTRRVTRKERRAIARYLARKGRLRIDRDE